MANTSSNISTNPVPHNTTVDSPFKGLLLLLILIYAAIVSYLFTVTSLFP